MNNTKDHVQLEIDATKAQMKTLEARLQDLEDALNAPRIPDIPEFLPITDRTYKAGKYHITELQYKKFCDETGHRYPLKTVRDNYPIVNVSYYDAVAYAEWLTKRMDNGMTYRLPTEDEYEKIFGDFEATNENTVFGQTEEQPVGTKKPNAYGLYDPAGLVWNWTSSIYA